MLTFILPGSLAALNTQAAVGPVVRDSAPTRAHKRGPDEREVAALVQKSEVSGTQKAVLVEGIGIQ